MDIPTALCVAWILDTNMASGGNKDPRHPRGLGGNMDHRYYMDCGHQLGPQLQEGLRTPSQPSAAAQAVNINMVSGSSTVKQTLAFPGILQPGFLSCPLLSLFLCRLFCFSVFIWIYAPSYPDLFLVLFTVS